MITVRSAEISDAERLVEIYDYYVRNTAITFEYETPSLDEFKGRMSRTLSRYPYIAAETDGIVRGYAYAGPFVGRAAYDRCCEVSVYVDCDHRKTGIGRMLYEALEARLADMGILNLYALIGFPETEDEYLTSNSADFHAHMGYIKAGEFHKCGYKFGRWYNMVCMEKIIGEHTDCPAPISISHSGK